MGRRVTVPIPGYQHVASYHGFSEYLLTINGLRVLVHHVPDVPVAGLMVTYLVGSRHEAVGHTGATHLLEHLMFKGSKNFPVKRGVSVVDSFSDKGALVNATTSFDRTNYYEVLPLEHLEFAIQVEADRMRNAIITKRDLIEEMPAVRSEFAMYENQPVDVLERNIWATAYQAHPYHHPIIGWLPDIENVTLERLQEFYDTYYWPNNAYVTIVSSLNEATVLKLVKKYFGVHKRSPHTIAVPYTKETLQTGRRTVTVTRAGHKEVLGLAWKAPEGLHEDTPALLALVSILTEGKTSRLYTALIETGLALSVHSMYVPFYDPSLFHIYTTPAAGVSLEKVEGSIMEECKKLITKGVTNRELASTVAHIQTDMAFARDGHYAMLSTLNEAIAVGDWKFFFTLPERVAKLTTADVKNVATRYVMDDRLTVGYYRTVAPTKTQKSARTKSTKGEV